MSEDEDQVPPTIVLSAEDDAAVRLLCNHFDAWAKTLGPRRYQEAMGAVREMGRTVQFEPRASLLKLARTLVALAGDPPDDPPDDPKKP